MSCWAGNGLSKNTAAKKKQEATYKEVHSGALL
jgi:hypothetical protein